tara:strand:+ start:25 stop:855 length:831 start_codon:yes stop_codon:yes gene_type:complete
MKILDGSELASYIKERQAKQVRGLRQAYDTFPKLAIIVANDSPVIDTYIRLKEQYGDDILVDVEVHKVTVDEAIARIESLNQDESVHGIIVQLPVSDESLTDQLLDSVLPQKDVDGLGSRATLDPATPMAINWLLSGYNVDLEQKRIVIVGAGRLVGAPLARLWLDSGYDVTVVAEPTDNLAQILLDADVIVSATGQPGLIASDMLHPNAVVVDAGTATEGGKIVGDIAADVRERHDLVITPEKGGVGPLTVCALFDNVIRAARDSKQQRDDQAQT